MPITLTVKGNLLDLADSGAFSAIVHGCNCFHTMGSGIARDIRQRWPSAYEADTRTRLGDPNKLGQYSNVWEKAKSNTDFIIINGYTQYYFGTAERHVSYEAIGRLFQSLNDNEMIDVINYCNKTELPIGIPLIGCGLAGGDWGIVYNIIDKVTPRLDIVVVEYEKG